MKERKMNSKEFRDINVEELFLVDGGEKGKMFDSIVDLGNQIVGWVEGLFK